MQLSCATYTEHLTKPCVRCATDVCDDNDYAARAKADYHEKARSAGVPAITSGGIYPGVSNIMAAHMVSTARREYDTDGQFVGKDGANKGDAVEPKKLQYFYYTAGTGASPVCLCACVCLHACVCLLVLHACLSVRVGACRSVLPACLQALNVCLSVCLTVCLTDHLCIPVSVCIHCCCVFHCGLRSQIHIGRHRGRKSHHLMCLGVLTSSEDVCATSSEQTETAVYTTMSRET